MKTTMTCALVRYCMPSKSAIIHISTRTTPFYHFVDFTDTDFKGRIHFKEQQYVSYRRQLYSNATLPGLPDYQYHHLQSAVNVAAKPVFNLSWTDHVTSFLIALHCLSAVDRVNSQGHHADLPLPPQRSRSAISVFATASCDKCGLKMSSQVISTDILLLQLESQLVCLCSFVFGCQAVNEKQSTENRALSIVAAAIQMTA